MANKKMPPKQKNKFTKKITKNGLQKQTTKTKIKTKKTEIRLTG